MKVTVTLPVENQGHVMSSLTKRKGMIMDTEVGDDAAVLVAEVPLNGMFGYSTELRSLTQGKGEFTMEYKDHLPVVASEQQHLVEQHQKTLSGSKK